MVTFSKEILNKKLHSLCSESYVNLQLLPTINIFNKQTKKKQKKTVWPLFMDGFQLPQG